MLREIGSDFWSNIEYEKKTDFHIRGVSENKKKQYYISGRSAIRAFARNVKVANKKILIPAFNCETVIVPFEKEGWDIAYYGIQVDLKPNKQHLLKCIESFVPSVVFLQSYFGFDTLNGMDEIIALCKKKKIILIEDLTQCLFSDFKKIEADYHVLSLRKFIAIPEGGMLLSQEYSMEGEMKGAIPQILEVAREAFRLKQNYMEELVDISKEMYLEKFNELKRLISVYSDIYEINEESKNVLFRIDSKLLIKRRRDNYKILFEALETISWLTCIFKIPNQLETPLYFPIYCNDAGKRKEIQSYLSANDIYCPIIWPRYMKSESIDKESKKIYDHILCIPCDQRYGIEEMQKIIQVVKNI